MEQKKKRIRSPNFPFISLEEGLGLSRTIYNDYNINSIALPVLSKALDISIGSYLAQHISALSQYGLISTEGEKEGRKIKISDIAYKIIIDDRPISKDRDDSIKKAALNPLMFRKLYEKYPNGLPSDEYAIDYELKVDHSFNPNSTKDFIRVFKSTMAFAKLYFSGKMASNNINAKEPEMNDIDNVLIDSRQDLTDVQAVPLSQELRNEQKQQVINRLPEAFPITLKDDKKAVISFSSLPIKKADIELIKKYLDLMTDNWSLDDEKEN